MKILGIDPGTTRIGYGVVHKDLHTTSCSYVASGLIEVPSRLSESQKLHVGRAALLKVIATQKPDVAAIEKIFFFKNAKTVINVAQARGVIMETLEESHIPTYEYTPLEVKQATSTYGRASKRQIQHMVMLLLGLKTTPKPDDVADALAIAICCGHSIR